MKRFYVLMTAMMLMIGMTAQEGRPQSPKFSPEKFDAELQEFIIAEAKLTQQESAQFFPVYKEMQCKQRVLFDRQKALGKSKPEGEEACLKAIKERDEIDLEIKRIQQTYHKKFLNILPASKVYDILQAESKFHRRMLKRFNNSKTSHQHEKPRK